ncbi:MAG: hypothetical protein P8X39_10845, partial [Desulfofustis sp.]
AISRILLFLALLAFLFVSIAAAGYVIFFRVVIASADHDPSGRPAVSMVGIRRSLPIATVRIPYHFPGSTHKLHSGAER